MTDYATGALLLHKMKLATATDLLFLHANVEFGVLQPDGNCLNIGICRITTTHYNAFAGKRPTSRRCPEALAELSVGTNRRLRVFFPKSGMLPCTERAFFTRPVFPVPLPHILSESVQSGLPELAGSIIPAGLYPIHRSDDGYWIEF